MSIPGSEVMFFGTRAFNLLPVTQTTTCMNELEEFLTFRKKFDCQEVVPPWSCKECGFSSHVLTSLVRHEKAGCGNQADNLNFLLDAYRCRNCEFISCSCIITRRHEANFCKLDAPRGTDSISRWICSHCEFTISYKISSDDKFECLGDSCSDVYARVEELREHATFVHLPDECLKFLFASDGVGEKARKPERGDKHPLGPDESKQTEVRDKKLDCDSSDYRSVHLSRLRQHTVNNHQSQSVVVQLFECQHCHFKTETARGLRSHKFYTHPLALRNALDSEYKSKLKEDIKMKFARILQGKISNGLNVKSVSLDAKLNQLTPSEDSKLKT